MFNVWPLAMWVGGGRKEAGPESREGRMKEEEGEEERKNRSIFGSHISIISDRSTGEKETRAVRS